VSGKRRSETVCNHSLPSKMADKKGGAGMMLVWDIKHARISVQEVMLKGPADTAGVCANDEILEVAGQDVLGKKLEEVAALLTGVPGTNVELTVTRKGGGTRTAVVKLQVLGQAATKGRDAKKKVEMTSSEAARGTRTVSTSSDASFVNVEGSWDDCFAALAADDFTGKAVERLEAAVQAWRAGTDTRTCDARLLHYFVAWAQELGATDVQQVPAGGDGGFEALAGHNVHTCGVHAKAEATALLVLSFPGRSTDGRGRSGGQMAVHLHAGAVHAPAAAPTASPLPVAAVGRERGQKSSVGESQGLVEGLDGFEHISLSADSQLPANGHDDTAADSMAKGTVSLVMVDGITCGLLSAVSWLLAIETCRKNAAPLPTGVTLLIEGANEFALGSPTLCRLAPHALAPSLSTSRAGSSRVAGRKDFAHSISRAGNANGTAGRRAWVPGGVSFVTLSGVTPWAWGEGEVPTVCHGSKGSIRLSVDLCLGTEGQISGNGGIGTAGGGCYHSGYMGGMMKDAVSLLAMVLVKLNTELVARDSSSASYDKSDDASNALSVYVDDSVCKQYTAVAQQECARRAALLHSEVHNDQLQKEVHDTVRNWLSPVLCLRRICGIVPGGDDGGGGAEGTRTCSACSHDAAMGLTSRVGTRPVTRHVPPPLSLHARAQVELLFSHRCLSLLSLSLSLSLSSFSHRYLSLFPLFVSLSPSFSLTHTLSPSLSFSCLLSLSLPLPLLLSLSISLSLSLSSLCLSLCFPLLLIWCCNPKK